ncbi:MAG: UDP-GlcNAc--UDP-phosphate GlcNAc-1-phosphate transferase [Bacteroidetes bacterium]|nr:UDP-GlcNAc--UDP-phosphate GlcNAc-1-phosphate transferase [Bacteroidota bacterium]
MYNSWLIFGAGAVFLLAIELIYFKIAARYDIIDKPNERSSHSSPIIRGGGILFLFSVIGWFVTGSFSFPWFVTAVLIASVVSFTDDLGTVNFLIRMAVQCASILLIFFQLDIYTYPVFLVIAALIVSVGTLNAFNFMDGINGITGMYSLVTLATLYFVQTQIISFTHTDLLIWVSLALIIFLVFNFRKNARCFAGDVGSISIALVIVFLIGQLIIKTNWPYWIFLLLVYGMDSVITIVFRLIRRENIFKPHRTHLYQYYSNELGYDHRAISVMYGLVQFFFNVVLAYAFIQGNVRWVVCTVVAFTGLYVMARFSVIRKVKAIK